LPGRGNRASSGRAKIGARGHGRQTAPATTPQLGPLAVAVRFLVEATASRHQPNPQTCWPRWGARGSSTSSVRAPVRRRRVSIRTATR
jgi:hypothetical protein